MTEIADEGPYLVFVVAIPSRLFIISVARAEASALSIFMSTTTPARDAEEYSGKARYFLPGLCRPTRSRIRRTFLGDIERRVATRETLRPSLSQTLGTISSANSSVIC